MSNIVISVENLSKSYRLGQIGTGTLSRDLEVWWAKVRGKPNPLLKIGQTDHGNQDGQTLWALQDVSFQVQQGEVLGIIGRNGAGKSTLLKILSRVTAPTSGQVKVKGRIASLLEVGTGFHPELTGRENIFLNGAILGMSKQEVQRKFDEIVSFAEVEKFVDTPVKRYSSGMYVRLAFAVAAHLESEILLVDEVLAVGDAEFQKKCLGKMGDVATNEGRTVLFVSHNMNAVQNLCEHSIWIKNGKLKELGDSQSIVSNYLKDHQNYVSTISLINKNQSGGEAKFIEASLFPQEKKLSNGITIIVKFKVEFLKAINCNYIFYVYREGQLAFVCTNLHEKNTSHEKQPRQIDEIFLEIPPYLLNPGYHSFGFAIVTLGGNNRQVINIHDVLPCEIEEDQYRRGEKYFLGWGGAVSPILPIKVQSENQN
jgi:lipopolysaccharide transport system ATP-binding protein